MNAIRAVRCCALPAVVCSLMMGCSTSRVISKEEEGVPSDAAVLKARQPLPLAQRKRMAVLDFDDRTDYGNGRIGRSAANILMTYLDRSGQFALYERELLNKIMEEQKIAKNQPVAAGDAASLGKTIGVDLVVCGTVSGFGYRTQRSEVLIFGSHVERTAEATVDIRIIEVATGRIVASESGRGAVTVATGKVLGVGSSAGYDETAAGDALRAAISKYVDKLIDQSLYQR